MYTKFKVNSFTKRYVRYFHFRCDAFSWDLRKSLCSAPLFIFLLIIPFSNLVQGI